MDKKIWGTLWVTGLVVLLTSCGQGPSFVDKTSQSERQRSEDVIGAAGSRGEADSGYIGQVDGNDDAGIDEGDGSSGDTGSDGEGDGTGGIDSTSEGTTGDDTMGDGDGSSGDGSSGDTTGGDNGGDDTMADGDGSSGGDAGADDGVVLPEPVLVQRAQTFTSESLGNGAVNASLEEAYLSQDLVMQRDYNEMAREFTQIVRPAMVDRFTQGRPGQPNSENFVQNGTQPLDLLIVVDNSGSMEEEQVNLSTKLEPLLTYVADSDWRIGVTTTDTRNGCLVDVINKGDSNVSQAFSNAVRRGTNGSGNERGVLQAVNGLICDKPSWVRAESTVAVLIVTDEDNCSDGTGCGNNNYASKDYLLNYLDQIRTPGVDARVFGIFWHPSADQSQCSTARNKANIYSELVNETGGAWGSICDSDYSATLENISLNIATILKRKFSLQHAPDPGSLQVYIDNVLQTGGYNVSGADVIFDIAPADGASIGFDYTYGARPQYLTFSLRQGPLDDEIVVAIDGMAVPDSEYSYDDVANKVTFNDLPPAESTITISYTKDVPLMNAFPIGTAYVEESLRVFINQVETIDYQVVGRVVQFPAPPAEGSLVTLVFTEIGDPILIYPFTVNGAAAKDITITDADTGEELVYFYLLGHLSFLAGDFEEGRVLKVEYWNDDRNLTDVTLPAMPLAGSVSATGGGVVCAGGYISVSGQTVTVSDCGFPPDVNDIIVNYQYVVQQYTSFTVTDPIVLATTETLTWKVFVNGVETMAYTLDESTFTVSFPGPLPVGTTVKIEVSFYEQM